MPNTATLAEPDLLLQVTPTPDMLEFVRSLPHARFDRESKTWKVLPTPYCLWRLAVKSPHRFQFCPRSWAIAQGQVEVQHRLRNGALDQWGAVKSKTSYWTHQKPAYRLCLMLDAALLSMDMGCGKSRIVVDLAVNTDCRSILILCPTSVRAVWRREFTRHAAGPVDLLILETGSVKERAARAEQQRLRCTARGIPRAVVINYESGWRKPFAEWALSQDWDMLVLDESHRIKSPNGKASKFCAQVGRKARKRIALTGTPLPHSPLDVFAQYRALDPGIFGTSWHRFRNRYAVSGPFGANQIVGYKNEAELQELFALLAHHVSADVLDLPGSQHHERVCHLSPKANRIYRELESELIAEVEEGVVTVANALVKLLRLQQITSGYIIEDETDAVVELDTGKAELLFDLLEDLPLREPVVVFCRFRHDLDAVQRVAESQGRRYGELSGRRKDLTDQATMPPDIDVLAAQIQSGGVGIDLTRACYAVYFSLGFSLGDYLQSLARLDRPGQTRPVQYYHLICEHTVDRYVYRMLKKRQQVVDGVLEILKGGDENDGAQ